jgi:uncharacterized protein (TIGR04141 family)
MRFMVLDRQLISVQGETPFEPADAIDSEGRLLYVKRRRASSKTTYVFDQASAAITILSRNNAARQQLLERIERQRGVASDDVVDAAVNTISEVANGNPVEVVVVLIGSGGSGNPANLPLNTKIAADEAAKSLASSKASLGICHWGTGLDAD